MKVRNGFVSNSSSSAFLLLFPFQVESAEHLYKILVGDIEDFDIFASSRYDDPWMMSEMSEYFFNESKLLKYSINYSKYCESGDDLSIESLHEEFDIRDIVNYEFESKYRIWNKNYNEIISSYNEHISNTFVQGFFLNINAIYSGFPYYLEANDSTENGGRLERSYYDRPDIFENVFHFMYSRH